MLQKFVRMIGGDPHKREVDKLAPLLEEISALEEPYEKLSDEQLRAKTDEFRQRLAEGETLDDLLPEAFAVVREASKRTIGLRHFDVQMIGGIVLHRGMIAEMRTGEGKTLVATLPIYLNALTGRGVHLITVNDYLARRDARWMSPIYSLLGLTVGVLQMAARTENGQKAFLVDLEKTSPFEDQHQLVMVPRAEAYRADITYGTNSEFGFDYLRDNLTNSLDERVQRGHYYAIIDEVDNVLIDEARTPLIISGPASDDAEWYLRMAQVVRALNPEDYEINEKDRTVTLTEAGEAHVEQLLDMPMRDPDRPEDITPEQARVLGHLEQALKAQFLYRRNKDYIVQGGKVIIVDEFTGRLMPGRRWSEGLHQAVEAKEGVKVEPENVTYATITIQNYFRMYEKLAGMTGTAVTEAEEFAKIYKLEVLPIPTNLEYQSFGSGSSLIEVSDKDEEGYKYTYYARSSDSNRHPIFYRRKDYPDVVYRTEEAKLRAIILEILRYHVMGRPQLVGTTSVEHSERLSERLGAEPLRRLLQTFLVREAWLKHNKRQQGETIIPELQFLNRSLDQINASELRQFGRTVGLSSISVEDPENLDLLIQVLGLSEEHKPRLVKVLQGGIPHQVLNARKHDEESKIIASAGAFGAVTIATNMAGRGVDIKLGGELTEETYAEVTRVLAKADVDPYGMTQEQMRDALKRVPEEDWGVYENSVRAFLQKMEDQERVRELGGLHVIGSERHEARRIDNQLRGRSARQGDPGSSRFYLSLEDELMRLFGGVQVEGLLKRLNIDESLPIESNMVGKLVEQSQTRVEGSNFDVRKHLLEYDDVLNNQRQRIYAQRDRVFTKEDLSEDVEDMLKAELDLRVPQALADEEGPWKLLGYLDEIQTPINYEEVFYPSYTLHLLIEDLRERLPEHGLTAEKINSALLSIAESALDAEEQHLLRATREMLEKAEESLDRQREERFEAIDTFLEGQSIGAEGEEGVLAPRPQDLVVELSSLVRTPLKLNGEQMRALASGDEEIGDEIRAQVENSLMALNATRVVATMKRRLDDFTLRPVDLQGKDWPELVDDVLDAVEQAFEQRKQTLMGDQGQVSRDIQPYLEKMDLEDLSDRDLMILLMLIAQGTRLSFDTKTHRKGYERYQRLNYVFLAAHLLGNQDPQDIREDVLEHLQGAEQALQQVLGMAEWNRLQTTNVVLRQLDEKIQNRLIEEIGENRFYDLADLSLADFDEEDRAAVKAVLGKRLQNEIYRQLLLGVISQAWVDYLTQVEALRVSIGLEAFAQRDPLVQYKSRATEMFKQLLVDIRSGVVTRMFMAQPTRQSLATAERLPGPSGDGSGSEPMPAGENQESRAPQAAAVQGSGGGGGSGKKKKRKRH